MLIEYKNKRIFAFSDTHGRHRELEVLTTDILICAGDVCNWGDEAELQDFYQWFAELPAAHRLFVPGNHDLPFEFAPEYAASRLPKPITYIDQGCIIWDDICLYVLRAGMGLQLENLPRFIPLTIDILITHCPPKDILDDNGRWGWLSAPSPICTFLAIATKRLGN